MRKYHIIWTAPDWVHAYTFYEWLELAEKLSAVPKEGEKYEVFRCDAESCDDSLTHIEIMRNKIHGPMRAEDEGE